MHACRHVGNTPHLSLRLIHGFLVAELPPFPLGGLVVLVMLQVTSPCLQRLASAGGNYSPPFSPKLINQDLTAILPVPCSAPNTLLTIGVSA